MNFQFGIDQLLKDTQRLTRLKKASVGLVAHPASVTSALQPSADVLIEAGVNLIRLYGPQHGMRGEKQDNMIESADYTDPIHQIPVSSLYGEHRRPTTDMLAGIDIILFDLQDIGCRIYTYITTLRYFLEACGEAHIEIWVLDRPNPAGRPIDGLLLHPGQESFVGADNLPCRHGLTTGELALWFNSRIPHKADLSVITMQAYDISESPGYGWPAHSQPWVNPSPNASSLNMARCFPGTVLIEGTQLSEGRGTTTPLELIGAPGFPSTDILELLSIKAPDLTHGIILRSCHFEPAFHKHSASICAGLQLHTELPSYSPDDFYPYTLVATLLKLLRELLPEYPLWRLHDYEYELDRTPIDVINGGPWLREWVDDPVRDLPELFEALATVRHSWNRERASYLLY
jgi:uncharacterized protein YbbC (DUF1343 family)